jgi:hypothetical protein
VDARYASGGSINLTVFATQAFQPQLDMLLQRIALASGNQDVSAPWGQVSRHEPLTALLRDSGLVDVVVREEQIGYHLRDAQEWWEVVWHSARRLLVEQVPAAQRERLRTEHLAEVAALVTADGLWLDVPVLFARGHKPLVAAATS